VHLRRALLLFAIVLGLAAVAASVSRTSDDSGGGDSQPAVPSEAEEAPSPSVSSGNATPAGGERELVFEADRDQTRRLDAGQPAIVLVEVE
jgi:hypothetical protein